MTSNTHTIYCSTLALFLIMGRVLANQNCVSGIIISILKAELYHTVELELNIPNFVEILRWDSLPQIFTVETRPSAEPDGVLSFCMVCSWCCHFLFLEVFLPVSLLGNVLKGRHNGIVKTTGTFSLTGSLSAEYKLCYKIFIW